MAADRPEPEGAGGLLERLLRDPAYRAAFRSDPAGACRSSGLAELAAELEGNRGGLHPLELRESKSSLAGLVMAAAAEGVGVAELIGLAGHRSHGAAQAVELASAKATPVKPAVARVESPSPGGAASTEAVSGSVSGGSPSAGAAALLDSPHVSLPPAARSFLSQGDVDPRVVSVLETAAAHHTIVVGGLQSMTDPIHAQAVEIVSVDGEPVDASNVGARDLVTEIAALDPSLRPNEIATPWPIQAQGFYSDPGQNRLTLAFIAQPAVTSAAAGPPKPATAVFAAVPRHSSGSFQRKTVEFQALAPANPHAQASPIQSAAAFPAPSGAAISVSSRLLTNGQEQFAARLAQLTGLNPRVISAWELAEESAGAAQGRQAAGNFDWLNIGYFDSGTGQIAYDAAFKDPITAAEQTARFLKGSWGGASASIRAILATAGQSPQQQINAIADSDWASSHYGNGVNLRATYDELSDIQITNP